MRNVLILLAATYLVFVPRAAGDEKPGTTAKLSRQIDQRIAARWADADIKPVSRSDDAEFLRRAYLDLAGKIPPVAEVRRFLADQAPEKRRKIVDQLLQGAGYVTHFSSEWRDLLLLDPDVDAGRQSALVDLEKWLQKQFVGNVPYDRMVRTLLTLPVDEPRSERDAASSEPLPRLFYLGRENKPEELAAGVTRLFLGVRLECAQCHNHPHAKWTREHFWSQAVFFAGLRNPSANIRELTIPGTERKVAARFLDGKPLQDGKPGRRAALADWITSPSNPYFARAAVNRLWAHFFGIGLVDPVDDLTTENPPSHPELLDDLAQGFAESGYDFKTVIRAIMLSDPYQLSSAETRSGTPPSPQLFSRMNVKALRPAQVFDSLVEATGYRSADLVRQRTVLLSRFPRTERYLEAQSSIPQALALMNGALLTVAIRPDGDNALSAVLASPFLDTSGRIETLYLAALGRPPRAEEKARFIKYVTDGGASGNKDRALADLFWALLNSSEFIHNH